MSTEESVSQDALVQVLKKKDKEVKTLEGKLSKIEDRYVKLVRFNKILHEDRASFLKFAGLLLKDAETAFEEAAAQETPINFDLLASELESVEAKDRELNALREFVRLVFPQDSTLQGGNLDQCQNLDSTLRQKWYELEERKNASIREAGVVAVQNVASQSDSVKQMELEIRSLKNENTELSLQLQNLKAQQSQRAQKLQNKILGNSGDPEDLNSTAEGGPTTSSSDNGSSEYRKLEERVVSLQKENASLEKKMDQMNLSYRDELELSQKMLMSVKTQHNDEKKYLLEQLSGKERACAKAEIEISKMEEELDTSRMITRAAEVQANRDLILKEQSEETKRLRFQVRDLEQKMRTAAASEKDCKQRIRELEVMSNSNIDRAYMKEIVSRYITYSQKGDLKAKNLIPAICTIVGCSAAERATLMETPMPTSWLVLNQAVGTWASDSTANNNNEKSGSSSGTTGDNHAVDKSSSSGAATATGNSKGTGKKGAVAAPSKATPASKQLVKTEGAAIPPRATTPKANGGL